MVTETSLSCSLSQRKAFNILEFIQLRKFSSLPTLLRVFFFKSWELVSNFFKFFFCIYWGDHMGFVLYSGKEMNNIVWFSNVKSILRSWDKPNFVVMFFKYMFLKYYCIRFANTLFILFPFFVHERDWLTIFFVISLPDFNINVVVASYNELGRVYCMSFASHS